MYLCKRVNNSLVFALQGFYFLENVPGIFVAFIPISYAIMIKKNWRIGFVVHSLSNLAGFSAPGRSDGRWLQWIPAWPDRIAKRS